MLSWAENEISCPTEWKPNTCTGCLAGFCRLWWGQAKLRGESDATPEIFVSEPGLSDRVRCGVLVGHGNDTECQLADHAVHVKYVWLDWSHNTSKLFLPLPSYLLSHAAVNSIGIYTIYYIYMSMSIYNVFWSQHDEGRAWVQLFLR